MVLGAGLRHLHDAEDAGEALLEQPVLGLVAVHEADSLDVDLRVVAVVDLHARRRRAVAAGEARREEAGAVAGLRPPEPDTDLVLRLLLPPPCVAPPRQRCRGWGGEMRCVWPGVEEMEEDQEREVVRVVLVLLFFKDKVCTCCSLKIMLYF